MTRQCWAYLSSDPGIPANGTKGATVHFRAMAAALRSVGVGLDAFMARGDAAEAGFPAPLQVVRPKHRKPGVSGEVGCIAANLRMLQALRQSQPHDAVYERFSLFGLAGHAYASTLGIPLHIEVNAPLWDEAARYRDLQLRHTARAMAVDVLTHATTVFAVSRRLCEELVALGVAVERVHLLPNGYDPAFATAEPAPKPAALAGLPTLLFVGSMKPWHGIEFLLRAFEQYRSRPIGLWIVGDGPLADAARDAAAANPRIVYEGPVPHETIPAIVRAADAIVAPYGSEAPRYFSPLKVVEAIGAGRPLIASRSASVVDTIGTDTAPGLFTPGDVHDFARAVDAVLDCPGDARLHPDTVETWRDTASRVLRICASTHHAAPGFGVATTQ